METLLHKIGTVIVALAMAVSGLFSGSPAPAQITDGPTNLGATNPIESPVALFSTTLANSISSSATTMTLTSATTKDGTTLASSTYSFIIDEGTASEEFVRADCTGTACVNLERGISVVTGTTTVASLQKAHRRGASVKITDGPLLVNITRILNGVGTLPNPLGYNSTRVASTTFSGASTGSLVPNVDYVNYVGSSGCSDASTSVRGCVQIGTGAQMGSSTPTGSTGAVLVGGGSTATSSPGTAGSYSVWTQPNGKIKQNFLNLTEPWTFTSTTTASGPLVVTATSSVATTTVNGDLTVTGTLTGGVFTPASTTVMTSSGTWVKPANVTTVEVIVIGGGGGGGGVGTSAGEKASGAGGAGGYAYGIVTVSGNVTVTVGTGGAGGAGANDGTAGNNSVFAGGTTVTATGGGAGTNNNSDNSQAAGGSGGTCTNAHLCINGRSGEVGQILDSYSPTAEGGSNPLGFGGLGPRAGASNGASGTGYGAGGSGAVDTGTTQRTGGSGTNGVVIVRWYK